MGAELRHVQRVHPFAALVAVNDAHADVGMMQLQLMKPKVTLWLQNEVSHASQLERQGCCAELLQPT